MLFNTKFDLVVSIGEDCACSSYLRRCKLQEFSYPFDWLTKAQFTSRLELILNDFSNFLEKENLYPIEKPNTGTVDRKCDYWADKRYDFYFYHDFPCDETFEAFYPKVKEKYDRRISRLYQKIFSSKRILFVWWSRDKRQDINIIKEYYEKLSQKFSSKSVYLLLIEYSEKEEDIYIENNHILITRFDNISYKQNPNWNETTGNEKNNLKVFSQIKMRHNAKWYIKFVLYFILKVFIEILPMEKQIRNTLRRNLKINFYKVAL